MKYLVKISYLGTDFCGFQIQPNCRTVQGTLTNAFSSLFGGQCSVSGCSRTDSGVHATASYVSVIPPVGAHAIPVEKIPLAIAGFLPPDLSVREVTRVPDDFHIRHDVIRKYYEYLVQNSPVNDPFLVHKAWQYPYKMPENACEMMNSAAKYFIGEHDFRAFMSRGSEVSCTVRRIDSLSVSVEKNLYRFNISANGFLYNMVRIIVGTLMDVAASRLRVESIPQIIASGDRAKAGETAPPDGLYLREVEFDMSRVRSEKP